MVQAFFSEKRNEWREKMGPEFMYVFLSFLFRKLFGYEQAEASYSTQKFELTTLGIRVFFSMAHEGNCQITFKQYEW